MSEPHDDWLAAALRSGEADPQRHGECPSSDRIWSAVHLELPTTERLQVIDHVAECPVCAESWQLAMQLGAGAASARAEHPSSSLAALTAPGEPGAVGTSARAEHPSTSFAEVVRRAYRPLAAVAALLVLAVGITYMIRTPEPSDVPGQRGVPRILEDGVLPKDDFRLRWTAGPDGSRYDVVLTTVDLQPVAEARGLQTPEYRVPPERLAAVTAGTPLLFRVVAHTPDGTRLSSRTVQVSVR